MALANRPKLLIADEPTTALDVTIQAQIIDLLAELNQEFGMAVLHITHNMGAGGRKLRADHRDVWRKDWPRAGRRTSSSTIQSIPTRRRCLARSRTSINRSKSSNPLEGFPPDITREWPGLRVRATLAANDSNTARSRIPCCARCLPDTPSVATCIRRPHERKRHRRCCSVKGWSRRSACPAPRSLSAGGRCWQSAGSISRSTPRRRWAWSVNRAAARPRWVA